MAWCIWTGGPQPVRIFRSPESYTSPNGVQYPRNIWTIWTDAQLAAIDAYPYDPARPPAGQRVTGSTFALVSGRVVQTITATRSKGLDLSLADLLVNKLGLVNDLAESKIRAPMLHRGALFSVDDRYQLDIQAFRAVGLGGDWPDTSDSILSFTPAQFVTFADAATNYRRSITDAGRAHRVALRGIADVATLDAYDITQGWP